MACSYTPSCIRIPLYGTAKRVVVSFVLLTMGTGAGSKLGPCHRKEFARTKSIGERSKKMTKKNLEAANAQPSQSLTDDQIVTERKLPRRSFLTASGALLVGAGAVAFGARAIAQGNDPEKGR